MSAIRESSVSSSAAQTVNSRIGHALHGFTAVDEEGLGAMLMGAIVGGPWASGGTHILPEY